MSTTRRGSSKSWLADLSRAASNLASEVKSAVEEARTPRDGGSGSSRNLHSSPPPRPPPPPPPTLTPEERVARFRRLLSQKPMPLDRVKKACFAEGVPDAGGTASLRAISWKLLLSYLPPDRGQWQAVLSEQRESYKMFCTELTTDPHAGGGKNGSGNGGGGDSEIDDAEHPLTAQKDSKWAEWHADEELRAEIKKDVDRTLPDYSFYNRELPMGRLHAEAISRILFVYAKLNPGSSAAR